MANLITIEEYKSYKGISNPNKDDRLNIIIPAVSDLIKAYCGRSFIDYWTTPKTELISVSTGMNAIILDEHPLRLLSAISYNGTDITSDISIDLDLGVVKYPKGFEAGTDIIEVEYTGGFETTPSDIKLAAFELVDYYLDGEHKSRKSIGGSTIEYHQSQDNWPFHISGILDKYKDV